MAQERIENEHDARAAKDDFHKPKHHKSNVTVHVGPKGDHTMTGVGMDGFELDPDAMRQASDELARHRARLEDYKTTAMRLADHLPDGGSPVAHEMRRAYLDRADTDNGVQAVLEDYIAELTEIQTAIQSTLQAYDNLDSNAAAAMRTAGEVE